MKTFCLGAPEASWVWRDEFAAENVPLFISYSRLGRRITPYPEPARVPYYIDSRGFMELSTKGRWTISPQKYVADVLRWHGELGAPVWAAPQDWMCEPWILAKTSFTVQKHQFLTVWNYLYLDRLWFEQSDEPCPFIPVLQGWTPKDYRDCVRRYADNGVNLRAAKAVGIGSVCRRQDTDEIEEIVDTILADAPGLKLHGFGIKSEGISRVGGLLESSDSQAWSYGARRRNIRLPGCTTHKNCNYCPRYALAQYRELAAKAAAARPRPHQISLLRELELAS